MIARGYLKDVKAKEVSWLWKPYIAFGKVTLIQGDTGIGKTSLLMKVIADLSKATGEVTSRGPTRSFQPRRML